jgi:uncharacterized LabA/DUF88 family protein
MEHSRETIAMLIDADNSPSDKIDFILAEMAKYGVVNIRRAYGNWKSHSLKGWEDKLHDYAIRPIQQFDYTKGKNATDMAMTIDAMDLLYSKKLDAFCIVSSDSDFTPLVMRILSEGLNVYGFGQKSTPSPFVNACSTFLYVDSLGVQEKAKNEGSRRKSSQELKGDSKLMTLIRIAVDSAQEEDGWSNLAKIGKNISNQASFDPRNYGFKRLSDLIRSIDFFEIEFRNNNSELYIRDKRKARKSEGVVSESAPAPVAGEAYSSAPRSTVQEPVFTKPSASETPTQAQRHDQHRPPVPPMVTAPRVSAPVQAAPGQEQSRSTPPVVSVAPQPSAPVPAQEPPRPSAPVASSEPAPVAPEAVPQKAVPESVVSPPQAPVLPVKAEPEAVISNPVETAPVAEPPVLAEEKLVKPTVSRTSRSSRSRTRGARPAPPKPVAQEPATPEIVEPKVAEAVPAEVPLVSAEPEQEKKPRRPTRRRPTRKKSEGESVPAPAEPEG